MFKVLQSRFNFNNTIFHGVSAGTLACMILCFDIDAEKVYDFMRKYDLFINDYFKKLIMDFISDTLNKIYSDDKEWKVHGHKLNYYADRCCNKILKLRKIYKY